MPFQRIARGELLEGNEDPLSVNGYISQEEPTIGRPGYASTNEICVIAQEFQDLCGTPNSDDCPYTPPDRNGFLDKCQDNIRPWRYDQSSNPADK